MRGKLFRALFATMTVLVLGAGVAQAAPTVGRYAGYGGPVSSLGCDTNVIGGNQTGGILADIDESTYENCGQWGLMWTVSPYHPWQLHPDSQSGTVTTYTITNIDADVSGPFCEATIVGSAGASYDSAPGVLTVDYQATTVTYVDPANDCLGLITQGEQLPVLADWYDIVFFG
ncbi:MAG: hypothetical protein WBA97_17170 [Actinophytocola sp.]|uniref:hypothetical protein n=1 Tax=Actinophytocola sp. TaxID=1872138 RepID=UPI003C710525